jgi:hypothetical protein
MTYRELVALWDIRDIRYSGLRYALSDEGRAAAAIWRQKEIELLDDPEERQRAASRLAGFKMKEKM